ncbi:hypothetical protein P9112_014684 [Eukaryota sp. TZLM1-RC]
MDVSDGFLTTRTLTINQFERFHRTLLRAWNQNQRVDGSVLFGDLLHHFQQQKLGEEAKDLLLLAFEKGVYVHKDIPSFYSYVTEPKEHIILTFRTDEGELRFEIQKEVPSTAQPMKGTSFSIMNVPYQKPKFFYEFSTLLLKYLEQEERLLDKYHSNVLPFINSTGTGKTRFMIESCKSIQSRDDLEAVYFTFPRFSTEGSDSVLRTEPLATADFTGYFRKLMYNDYTEDRKQRVRRIVFACQCLMASALKLGQSYQTMEKEYFETLPTSMVNKAGELFTTYYTSSDNIALQTTNMLNSLSLLNSTKYVLFSDEVSSLIGTSFGSIRTKAYFNEASDGLDCDWNFFRCWRHAARNLLLSGIQLIVIVAGTHTALHHFCHDVVKSLSYRPFTPGKNDYMVDEVRSGTTLPPISTGWVQIFDDFLPLTRTSPDVSPLLSLVNAASCRPLWVAYARDSINWDSFERKIVEKAQHAFSETDVDQYMAAILSVILEGTAIHETVLTKFVHCTFAMVDFTCAHIGTEQKYFSFLVPTVDPLIAHCGWQLLLQLKDNEWQHELTKVLRELISTHVAPTTFGILVEPIAVALLLFLFQFQRSQQPPNDVKYFVNLYPLFLEHFLVAFCTSYYIPKAPSGWTSPWVLSIAESMLLHDRSVLTDSQSFFHLLLGAFIFRTIVILPDRTEAVDAIIPLVRSNNDSSISLPSLFTIQSAIESGNGHQYLGYVKIQIKTSTTVSTKRVFQSLRSTHFGSQACYSVCLLLSLGNRNDLTAPELTSYQSNEDPRVYVADEAKFSIVKQAVMTLKNALEVPQHKFRVRNNGEIIDKPWTKVESLSPEHSPS